MTLPLTLDASTLATTAALTAIAVVVVFYAFEWLAGNR